MKGSKRPVSIKVYFENLQAYNCNENTYRNLKNNLEEIIDQMMYQRLQSHAFFCLDVTLKQNMQLCDSVLPISFAIY
jgi:hypothetical protein